MYAYTHEVQIKFIYILFMVDRRLKQISIDLKNEILADQDPWSLGVAETLETLPCLQQIWYHRMVFGLFH